MRLKSLFTVFFFFVLSIPAYSSEDAQATFKNANSAYETGDYQKAIDLYSSLTNDYQSSDLLKNLGNAHFRLDNLGLAILYYEKAIKLNPDDEDAAFNLKYANNLTVDRLGDGGDDKIASFFKSLIASTASNNWAYINILLCFLFFGVLAYMFISKSIRTKRLLFLSSIGLAVILLTSFIFAYQAKQMVLTYSHAIVIDSKVDVKSEPNDSSADLFVLHEGSKIELLSEKGEWIEIMIPNGSVGWVERKDVEKI